MPDLWTPAPLPLPAEPGYAHILRLGLDLLAPRLESLRGLLSTAELARAERLRSDQARQRFIAAHGQLRQVLSGYLQRDPVDLVFITQPADHPQGKPALVHPPGSPDLRFNLTHSMGLALLAVTFGQEVGVDLEALDRPVDSANIARRFFTPAEADELLTLPAGQQKAAFFNLWTRKEAYLKARGLGLSLPLDSFGVTFRPGEPAQFQPPLPGWQLYALDPGPGFAAALVTEGEIRGLRCWDWFAAL